jgi:phospholipid/cholesterol/gamma-HCH transport system substrate-binding protein
MYAVESMSFANEMKLRLLIIVLLASSVLIVFSVVKASSHKSVIRTYFNDAHGLRAGAPVRVAGVEVGRVSNVRVRDDLRDKPAEVTMSLETRYELKIPSDAVVQLESDGVLGGNYPEIDIRNARGPVLPDGGTLKSEESNAPSSRDLLECLAAIANHQGCKLNESSHSALQHE